MDAKSQSLDFLSVRLYHYLMNKYDGEYIQAVFHICEKNNALNPVNQEHYQYFIDMADDTIIILIKVIFSDQVTNINENFMLDKWQSNKDITNYILTIIELFIYGIIVINDQCKICFMKPIGNPPDKDMESLLDKWLNKVVPIIDKYIIDFVRYNFKILSQENTTKTEAFNSLGLHRLFMTKSQITPQLKDNIFLMPFPKHSKS